MYSKLRGIIPRSSWVNVSESSEGPGEGEESAESMLRPGPSTGPQLHTYHGEGFPRPRLATVGDKTGHVTGF